MIRDKTDVLIVGAGMAGLTAAGHLSRAGRDVLVVDKGRGPGGRMAMRSIGEAVLEHGAQFLTAEDAAFGGTVARWRADGVVEDWPLGGDRPRWRGRPTMSGVAHHLARGLDVRCSCRVVALRREGRSWIAVLDSGDTVRAEAVLLTPPAPQALALLDDGGVDLKPMVRDRLARLRYDRCLAVMAVLDGPSRIPKPGLVEPSSGPIALIVDAMVKGVSRIPAVTIHADADYSLEHWERDRGECGRELLEIAQPWLGAVATEVRVHGWRYSRPVVVDEEPCLLVNASPPLLLAGDAFAGPRIEDAARSGRAAAEALLNPTA